MIPNIDIVFRQLALPFHIAVARFWTLLAVIAIGYVAVNWFEVEPVRIIMYGFVAMAVAGVAVSAQQWGNSALAGGIIATAIAAMVLMEPVFQRVLPKNRAYRLTQQIPVDFRFRIFGDMVFGQAVNRSRDWLTQTEIECQRFYANGDPVERPWTKPLAGHSWLPPGESTGERRLFQWAYDGHRYDMERTSCRVVAADFRQAPEAVPSLTYTMIPGGGFVAFRVTNDTPHVLTAVRFSCIQQGGIRVTFLTTPMFQNALDFALKPGETIALVSQRMFTGISDCLVYSVDTL